MRIVRLLIQIISLRLAASRRLADIYATERLEPAPPLLDVWAELVFLFPSSRPNQESVHVVVQHRKEAV